MKCNQFLDLGKHTDDINESRERMAAMCIIKKADPQRFSHTYNELENGTILGESNNIYPKTIAKDYAMLFKYKTPENRMIIPRNHVGVSLHKLGYWNQTSLPISGIYNILHRDVMCYICNMPGHYYGQLRLLDIHRTSTQSLQLGYSFAHTTPIQKDLINNNWILINSCYTVSYVMNPYLIPDNKDCHPNTDIHVITNGGHLDYK